MVHFFCPVPWLPECKHLEATPIAIMHCARHAQWLLGHDYHRTQFINDTACTRKFNDNCTQIDALKLFLSRSLLYWMLSICWTLFKFDIILSFLNISRTLFQFYILMLSICWTLFQFDVIFSFLNVSRTLFQFYAFIFLWSVLLEVVWLLINCFKLYLIICDIIRLFQGAVRCSRHNNKLLSYVYIHVPCLLQCSHIA